MARLYLDANYFIGLVLGRKAVSSENLEGHHLFISALSVHILYYVVRIKVPSKLDKLINEFQIVDFSREVLNLSLQGPIADLEDNVQLHSAAISDAEYFLTKDKELLKMKYFGKTKITNEV